MATEGWFDKGLLTKAWFDIKLDVKGWYDPILLQTSGTPGSYTLNLEPTSYTITGSSATTTATRVVTLSSSSYTVTGLSATTVATRNITLAPSSYSITGIGNTLTATRVVNLESSSYTITGFDVTFNKTTAGYSLVLDPNNFSITGSNASLVTERVINLSPGVYGDVIGSPVAFYVERKATLSTESYLIVGSDMVFDYTPLITVQRGGKSRRKVPEWLRRLLEQFDEDWAQPLAKELAKKEVPLEKVDKLLLDLPYFDLDTKQIYLALVLIEDVREKKRLKRLKEDEEILLLL